MEKAIHITSLKQLKEYDFSGYDIIYWGAEFCQNLTPSVSDTVKVMDFAEKKGMQFVLMTSFVTDKGMLRLKKIFNSLKKNGQKYEIVVNDWGVVHMLNTEYSGVFNVSLGRLLTRQQRDPSIKRIFSKQKPVAVYKKDGSVDVVIHKIPDKKYREAMMTSCVSGDLAYDFLKSVHVTGVELNNVIQGIGFKNTRLRKSLYTPYIFISTSRFCPMQTEHQRRNRINACRYECGKYFEKLRNKGVPKTIYRRGNTIFYKNEAKTSVLKENGIERLVFQPAMPF